MAFTDAELAALVEITEETKASVDVAADAVGDATEDRVQADIVLWNTNRNSLKVQLQGGRDGINFDTRTLLNEIRIRVRVALGYDPVSDARLALDPNAMSLFELEVGSGF
jgi:hypothetical protein